MFKYILHLIEICGLTFACIGTAFASTDRFVSLNLSSQDNLFTFTIPAEEYGGTQPRTFYQADNPLCETVAETHGPGIPYLTRKTKTLRLKATGTETVIQTQLDGFCKFKSLYAIVRIAYKNFGAGQIEIYDQANGKREQDLFCKLDERKNLYCRNPGEEYFGATKIALDFRMDRLTLNLHLED